jgi:hypothetical protein
MAPGGVAVGLVRNTLGLLENPGVVQQEARFAVLMPTENQREKQVEKGRISCQRWGR